MSSHAPEVCLSVLSPYRDSGPVQGLAFPAGDLVLISGLLGIIYAQVVPERATACCPKKVTQVNPLLTEEPEVQECGP